jgi:guanylate kinase
LLEIDLAGARQVRRVVPAAQFVFLAPPSLEELRQRLTGRGTEDDAVIAERLARAQVELAAACEFDAVIVNDDAGRAAAELVRLIELASPPLGSTP